MMAEATPATANGAQLGQDPKPVSKRGRRIVAAIIIILILALLGIALLLASLVSPRAGVAPADQTGGLVWVRSIYGWGSTPETQFQQPHKLDIDEDGTIWVTDARHPGQAFAFSPDGQLSSTVGQDAQQPLRTLGPISVGFRDRVFIGESVLDWVRVFTKDGEDLGAFSVPNPIDIAYSDGILVVSSRGGFAIIDPETGVPVQIIGSFGRGEEEFDTVNGVAIDSEGYIYVSDAFNNRLAKYDSQGERVWMVPTGAPGNQVDVSGGGVMAASRETTIPAAMQLPAGVTIDGNNRVVVADTFDFSISVFDSEDGEFIAKYGEHGLEDGQLIYPISIAYDAERDWFAIGDSGNSRVQIVRIPGSSSGTDLLAGVRRSLSGPLRACIPPLVLLLVVAVIAVIRSRRKRIEERRAAEAAL